MTHSRKSAASMTLCLMTATLAACAGREVDVHVDGASGDSESSGDRDGSGPCQERPLWDSTSLSFSLARGQSYFTNDVRSYEFSLAARTLTRQGCRSDSHVDRSLSLGNDELAAVVATLGALRTTCSERCGTDAPNLKLTIHAGNGDRTYVSDQLCSGPPPYVPVQAMNAFEASLDAILDDASTAMDGGVEAAARCPVFSPGN